MIAVRLVAGAHGVEPFRRAKLLPIHVRGGVPALRVVLDRVARARVRSRDVSSSLLVTPPPVPSLRTPWRGTGHLFRWPNEPLRAAPRASGRGRGQGRRFPGSTGVPGQGSPPLFRGEAAP